MDKPFVGQPGEHPVEAAIREGKIPDSRRDHYMRLMAKKPKKTAKLLASMEAVLEPPEEMEAVRRYVTGRSQPQPQARAQDGPTEYPKEWLNAAAGGTVAAAPPSVGGNILTEPGATGGRPEAVAGPGEIL